MNASEQEQNLEATDSVSAPLTRSATGPRTAAGKERSKHNALTHGIFSKVAVLKDEPRAEFDSLLRGFRDSFQPVGAVEEVLVEQLAVLIWRRRRLLAAEANIIEHPPVVGGDMGLGFGQIESMLNRPDRLFRYEAGIERSFGKALDQLERLQRIRRGECVLPKLEVRHSID